MPQEHGGDFVQGVVGTGDSFMIGEAPPVALPPQVIADVQELALRARELLGPVRLEWAHDGRRAWIVQIHIARHFYVADQVLSNGEAEEWLEFHVEDGLDRLREIIPKAIERGAGILVRGSVGITSHVGDLLRKAHVPSRLEAVERAAPL